MAEAKTIADLIRDRFGLPARAGENVPAEGMLAQLLGHRTHRRYTADPVPDDVLEIALSAALSSPSKSDLQQVGVIVVRDRAKQAAIGALITAATALGLGCCPISVIRNHVETVSQMLELPPGVFPVAGLSVGYPSQAGWTSMRLPPALTVHTDRYDDSALGAELEAYDRRREARHATPRESQRFAERFGYTEPYGWSEDKARQHSVPEGHNFGPFIRSHGFGLT